MGAPNPLFSLAELEAAAQLVHRTVPPTPQYAWPLLAKRAGCEVWVKHENHTPTGSFKARGAVVYMDALHRTGKMPVGVVTATRGNHGQSVAIAAARYGIPAIIVVPEGNSAEKNAAMVAFGGQLVTDTVDAPRPGRILVQHRLDPGDQLLGCGDHGCGWIRIIVADRLLNPS